MEGGGGGGGGGGGVLILLFSEVTLFEYSVSTILSPIVARKAAQSCMEGVRRESFIFSFLSLQNIREALFSTNFVDDRSLYSSKEYPMKHLQLEFLNLYINVALFYFS